MFSIKDAIIFGLLSVMGSYIYFTWTVLPPKMDATSTVTFRQAVHTYKNFIQSGAERGSSFSVFQGNENVLNAFGGYTDRRFQLTWTQDTVTQGFTLGLLSIPFSFALLIERSLVNRTDPVVKYIPTFPAKNVTIADLLSHQAGYPYFLDPIQLSVWRDDYMNVIRYITNQVPTSNPKTRMVHIHSLALLADAVIRKVDPKHRTMAHFFMEEIAWPLGVDVMIGIPRSQLYRVARTYHADWTAFLSAFFYFDFGYFWTDLRSVKSMPYGSDRHRVYQMFSDYDLNFNLNPDLLEVPLASSHMFTNARSLARLFTILLSPQNSTHSENIQSTSKSTLFHADTVNQILQTSTDSNKHERFFDPVLQRRVQFTALGLMVAESPENTLLYGWWDDIMGQAVFVDPQRRITWAYMTNHGHGRSLKRDFILNDLVTTVYHCLSSGSNNPSP